MPKLVSTRPPATDREEQHSGKLAQSHHVPAIFRAGMLLRSWASRRTSAIATELQCHPQTVRERIARFNVEGLDALEDRSGTERKCRLTEADRNTILALVTLPPPGRLVRYQYGPLTAPDDHGAAHWTLDSWTIAVQARGVQVARSQIRRIFVAEGVRWRPSRLWVTYRS